MPFSQISQISPILQYIDKLFPQSLLDVGMGMGQYGFLARINLEGTNLFHIQEQRQTRKDEWRIQIDGIEGCEGYMTPVHHYAYHHVMIGDALKILPTLSDKSYELVLAIDILEHFSYSDGLIFLSHLKRIAQKSALVSTPKEFIPQDVPANPYENHRSLWTWQSLVDNGFKKSLDNDASWIALYETF